MEPRGRRDLKLAWVICAIGLGVSLFSGSGKAVAERLPEVVTGKAQVYDGVTFGLIQNDARYRTVTRIRLEAVDACEVRQKARLADVEWPCGAVAAAWLTSRTLTKEVECRPTRVLSGGGFRAQCYVDGVDIAGLGLGQGMYVLAVPEHEYPPPGYAEAEARAKAASAGIWSSEFMMPAQWSRAHGTYNPLAPQRW